mmetsp:Transcript_40145/g.67315  ORF Transcript_40145/g.67315 Transcript_40145/m.67315 type:complete len:206 (-) Transcript_40145:60-677(-)
MVSSTLMTTTTSTESLLFSRTGGSATWRPSPAWSMSHPRRAPMWRCGSLAMPGGSTSNTDNTTGMGLAWKSYTPRCLRTTPERVSCTSLACMASPDIRICPPLAASPSNIATFTACPENWTCLVTLLSSLMYVPLLARWMPMRTRGPANNSLPLGLYTTWQEGSFKMPGCQAACRRSSCAPLQKCAADRTSQKTISKLSPCVFIS